MASDPIKTSELYQDTGELKKLIAELETVISTTDRLRAIEIKTAKELAASARKANPSTAGGRKQLDETAALTQKVIKAEAQLMATRENAAKELAVLREQQKKANTELRLSAREAQAAEGSYDQLAAQYGLIKLRLNAMSIAERENTEEGRELVRTSKDIFKEMKRLQEQTGKHVLSVGDYTKSIRDAAKNQRELVAELDEITKAFADARKAGNLTQAEFDDFTATTKEMSEQVESLGRITGKTADDIRSENISGPFEDGAGAVAAMIPGMDALIAAMRTASATPLLAILGALVAVSSALFGAFTRTEKGAKLLRRGSAALSTAMALLTRLSSEAAKVVVAVFEDPIGSIIDLRDAIRENIEERFKALPLIFKAAGKALTSFFKRDMKGVTEAGEDMRVALVQAATGLNEIEQSEAAKALNDIKEKAEELNAAYNELAEAQFRQRANTRSLSQEIERLNAQQQLAASLADDDTRSFAAREEASKRALQLLEARAAAEVKLAKQNLGLINQELDLRLANKEDVEDLLDSQSEAYREVIRAEGELLNARQDNASKEAKLIQDKFERDLDILIDGFDNQKTVNQARIADESLSLDARRKILDETVRLSDSSFAAQIANVQQFTEQKLDADSLILESDAIVLNQRIRALGLSEIYEGRLLEIIRDRKSANQDLLDFNKQLAAEERKVLEDQFANDAAIREAAFMAETRTAEEIAEFRLSQRRSELENIVQLNTQFLGQTALVDTSQLQANIITSERELALARITTRQEAFDQEQEQAASAFNIIQRTQREQTLFTLKAERERLLKQIELNEKFGGELTAVQIQTIKNTIEGINNELNTAQAPRSIFEIFGLDDQGAIAQSTRSIVNSIKGYFSEIAQARQQAADAALRAAETEAEASKAALSVEIANRDAGYAHDVKTASKRLQEAQRQERLAQREQERAARAQRRLQTIEQTSSLITASAKLWASFAGTGPLAPVFAGAAIAAMWGSFAASKIRANQLAKEEFAEGGYFRVGGGSHASGNDTFIGQTSRGTMAYAERGESVAVFNPKAVRQYGSELPALIDRINRGMLNQRLEDASTLAVNEQGLIVVNNSVNSKYDKQVANDIHLLRKASVDQKASYYVDALGRTVEVRGNTKRTYC